MRRILSIIIIPILLLCTMITTVKVQAKEINPFEKGVQVQVISEYQAIKNLKSKSDNELRNIGYTDKEIMDLRNFDYKNAIEKRAKLDKETLKSMGYSDKKVEQLKNFSGTEGEVIALSASAYIYSSFYYTTNGARDWYINFNWNWADYPFYNKTDIIGVRVLGSVNGTVAACSPIPSGSYATIKYCSDRNISRVLTTSTVGFSFVDTSAGKYTIPMYGGIAYDSAVGSNVNIYAMSGYGSLHVNNSAPMDRLTWRMEYGHSTSSGTPTISVSTSGSVSFGWKSGTSTTTEDYTQHQYDSNGTQIY